MASGKEVRAGKAFVEIVLRDQLEAGLKRAAARLRAFGSVTTAIGAGLTGTSAAIIAPLLAAVNQFSDVGDAVEKMAARTGMSAEAVSELAHAAGLSGTTVQILEAGMRRMQRTIGDAAEGTTSAEDALTRLGLSASALIGLSPDQQLAVLADRLSAIEDPAMRAIAAMDVFGRAGTQLLPMLADGSAGLAAMRDQARALGLSISTDTAGSAAKLNDALGTMWTTVKALTFNIGAALAPTITELADRVSEVAGRTIHFIRANQGLIVGAALAALAVGATGAALIGLGASLHIAGLAVGGFAALWGLASAALFLLPRTLGRVIRTVTGILGSLVSTTKQAVSRWSGGWGLAQQTFQAWQKSVASRVSLVRAALQPIGALAASTSQSFASAMAQGAARLSGAWSAATGTLATLPNRFRAMFSAAGGYSAAFVRGFTGDMALFTTRANASFWAVGATARTVFDRLGQYARASAPLVTGAMSAVAGRIVPIWNSVVQRIAASLAPLRQAFSTTWQAIAARTITAVTQMRGSLSSVWQTVSSRIVNTTAGAWNAVSRIIQRHSDRAASAVRRAHAALAGVASQQWQRIGNAAQAAASRVSAGWQRLPAWVRGPLSQIATMAGEDARRAGALISDTWQRIPSVATSVWQRIRAVGTSTMTQVASVTRSAMQRAFAAIQSAAARSFARIRALGGASMRSIGGAGTAIPGRMLGAFSSVGSAISLLAPAGGGIFGTLLTSLPVVASALGAVGAAIAGLLSPVGLVAAAVVGGIAAWTAWTQEGQQTLAALTQVFGSLWSVASKVLGGISNALSAGDWKLAARILWTGLKAAWFTGVAELNKVWPILRSAAQAVWQQIVSAGAIAVTYLGAIWSQLPQWLTGPLGAVGRIARTVFAWIGEQLSGLVAWATETFAAIGAALANGDFALAAEIAWASIQLAFAQGMAWVTGAWTEFSTGLASIFDSAVTAIRQVWNNIATWIARQILHLVGLIQQAVAKLAEIDPTGLSDKFKSALEFDVDAAIRILEDDSKRFGQGLDQAKLARDDDRVRDMQQQLADTERRLAELKAARDRALDRSKEPAAEPGESPLSRAMADLDKALADAAKARSMFDVDSAQKQLGPFDFDNLPGIGGSAGISGTFNAAIAGLLGRSGDDPAERTAEAVESMDEKLGEIHDELRERPVLAFDP